MKSSTFNQFRQLIFRIETVETRTFWKTISNDPALFVLQKVYLNRSQFESGRIGGFYIIVTDQRLFKSCLRFCSNRYEKERKRKYFSIVKCLFSNLINDRSDHEQKGQRKEDKSDIVLI